jgi:hypothetical protein
LHPWPIPSTPPAIPLQVSIIEFWKFFFLIMSLHLGKAPHKQLATKSSAARKTTVSLTHSPLQKCKLNAKCRV